MALRSFRSTFAGVALVALLAGCQTTSIQSAWFDTGFAGPPMRKVVVSASVGGTADSRTVEDVFVEKLRAAGVEAVAGHTVRLDVPGLPDASFTESVLGTGAQGLLLVRLLDVDTRTQVSTRMVHGGSGWGRGGWGGTTRTTMIPVQQVSQYDLATVETKLFEVQSRQLVWTATTSTFNPRSAAREAPGFAGLIIGQLASRDIISSK
jgi:hypothetical protein